MKPVFKLGLCALAISTLMACSSSESLRQASGGFEYLETQPLETWKYLSDQQDTATNEYTIPAQKFNGAVGGAVDIRPPMQLLSVIPGAQYENRPDSSAIWFSDNGQAIRLATTLEKMNRDGMLPIVSQTAQGQETGWIKWDQDKDNSLEARYMLAPIKKGSRYGFRVQLIEARRNGVVFKPTQQEVERYNTMMTNLISSQFDVLLQKALEKEAQALEDSIYIEMDLDRNRMPVIVADAPYELFWEALPSALARMGFNIEDRNRSQGVIDVEYVERDEDFWQSVGLETIELPLSNYRIQLGDLGNSTSINFTDRNDKPIDQETLSRLSDVLAIVLEEQN